MKKKRVFRSLMSMVMAAVMVIGMVPADVFASAESLGNTGFTAWAQGWNTVKSDFTDVKYEVNQENEIIIPLDDAGYNAETGDFEGIHFQSDPETVWGKDNWELTDDLFGSYQGYFRVEQDGQVILYAQETIYNKIKETVEQSGEFKTPVRVGKKDIFGGVDENNIYKEFTLVFTGKVTEETENHKLWTQSRDITTGELTDTRYELNERNEITVPLEEAAYNTSTGDFEGISFQSEPETVWGDDNWELTDDLFTNNQGYIRLEQNGQAILYAQETVYNTIKETIDQSGEFKTSVRVGKKDIFGGVDEEDIYGEFILIFTGEVKGENHKYEIWTQGRDTATGELTDVRYDLNDNNEIVIPLEEASYNTSTGDFEGMSFQSEPETVWGDDNWELTDGLFTNNQGYIRLEQNGQAVLYAKETVYNAIKETIGQSGEFKTPVRVGKKDIFGGVDESDIYGEFTLVFTGETEENPPIEDSTVVYKNNNGNTVTIQEGDTLTVKTTESGTFTCGSYDNDKEEVKWSTTWDGDNQSKPVWIGLNSGELYVASAGTVNAQVSKSNGELLCSFKIVAEEPKLEEIKLFVDNKEVTNGSYTVEGHQGKTITVKGRYEGEQEFLELPNTRDFTVTSDEDYIYTASYNGAYFYFDRPGKGNITVSGYGAQASFQAESTYVPVESIKLSLPSEVKMHHLVYSMGSGDNYMGVNQTRLSECVEVIPSNSSYYRVGWESSDNEVADYHDTHSNGFIGHKEGTVTITATVNDNGTKKSDKSKVKFVFEKPVEGISLENGQETLTLKEESDMELPLVFEPNGEAEGDQPSQTTINWSFSKEGIVKISQSRGEYDNYASKTFVLTALSEGEVEVTGTPVVAKDGVEPLKFKVQVTESDVQPPDNKQLVSAGLNSCSYYYLFNKITTWAYNSEWDIIALKRAGETLGRDENSAIESYKDSIKQQIDKKKLTADSKPTDLARVALALEAIGVDASSFEGFNFYEALLNSDRLEDTSNEAIWALIALDAKKTEVPKGSKYDRDKLLDAIISFQAEDGGFGLDKNQSTGGIDMTGMALQALCNYQDNEKAKDAVDKAITFLQESMQSTCDFNGTSEALSQVIIAISSLGLDITAKENGFTSGKSKNAFVALEKYRVFDGFKHSAGEKDANHMSTQQAYMALASWDRLTSNRNAIYDMTDVESDNYILPVIQVTGAEDKQSVTKSSLTIGVSADAGKDKVDKLQVWCNDQEIKEDNGKYLLKLDKGNNSLSVKAVSSKGAVAYLSWTIKFAPADYQGEVDKQVTSLTKWAESYFNENNFELTHNKLLTTYMRTAGLNQYYLDEAVKQIQNGAEFKSPEVWSDAVLALTASGVDIRNIYGRNLWDEAEEFISNLSMTDSINILKAVNSRYGQKLPESLSKEELLGNIVPNIDGGFGAGGSNVYDTAEAVIALVREESKKKTVDKAVDWIADHQTIDGKFSDTGSYSDLECLTKVMEALCAAGIDFTMDDRFNDPANLYTNMKTYYESQDNAEKALLYCALSSYQRLYKGEDAFYNMDAVIVIQGLTVSEENMEQTTAEYLKGLDYTVYSPDATEAAYLLIRGNQATKAVYGYLDVLVNAVKEKSLNTPKECFFAGLYLKESGMDLTDIDGVNLFDRLDEFPYTKLDSFGTEQTEATVHMSYAVMTLRLQPENNESKIGAFVQRINSNRVPDTDWQGKGFYEAKGAWMSTVKPDATIMAMISLFGEDVLTDTEPLIEYLGGKDVKSYEERQVETGYWADFRKDSNNKVGNLEKTADMVIGLPMFGVDIRTDSRFQKEKGDILHGIRAFYRAEGFADTPEGENASAEGSVAGYRALLALRMRENQLPGIYDVATERPIDRSRLDTKVNAAKTLVKDDYTPDTWSKLEEALSLAEQASTQKEINLALEAVTNAVNGLKSSNEITVSFRLIGDWKHGKDGEHTKYVNWFKTKTYIVDKNAKVYDVFVLAMKDAGMETDGEDFNYVKMVTAPAVFGSYELSEFDNGRNSGWKYMVNEEYPGVGLKDYRLTDGDSIIWRYVDNYADSYDNIDKWKEAEDLEPAEIFESIRTGAKEEIAVYLNAEDYETAQQEAAAGIVADTQKKLDEAENTVSIENILKEAKKNLDALPTKEDLEAERNLSEAKDKAKELLKGYKDMTLYLEEQQKELNSILEGAYVQIDAAGAIAEIDKTVEDAKAAMDAVKTAVQSALDKAKEAARNQLSTYKNLEFYREAQKAEIKKILADALKKVEAADSEAGISEIVSEASKAMDAVKTAAELKKEEDQAAADTVIKAIDKITEPVTEAQRETIENARKAYNALTQEQKGLVTNYDKLTAAEKAIGSKPNQDEKVTLTNEEYGVTLSGNKLTGSMILTVTPLAKDSKAVAAMRKEIPSSKAIFRMYEIKLMKDGKEIELPGDAELSIPVGDKYNSKELTMLCYRDEKVQKINGKAGNGIMTVTVTGLGSFSVVVDASSTPAEKGNNTSNNTSAGSGSGNNSGSKTSGAKTGDDTPVEIMFLLMMAACMTAAAVSVKRKKYKR